MHIPATLKAYLLSLFYDFLLVNAILFAATIIYMISLAFNLNIYSSHRTNLSNTAFQSPLYKTWLFLIWFSFFAYFWTRAGQTLGLRVWRLKIENYNGGLITIWQALLRFFSALSPWVLALFLYYFAGKETIIEGSNKNWIFLIGLSSILWSLVDKDGLTLHDRFSETRIVSIKKEEK